MTDKIKNIPNDGAKNYPFRRLQLVDETLEHSTYELANQNSKSSKLLIQRIRKRYCKTLGTSVINSSLSTPPSVSH